MSQQRSHQKILIVCNIHNSQHVDIPSGYIDTTINNMLIYRERATICKQDMYSNKFIYRDVI